MVNVTTHDVTPLHWSYNCVTVVLDESPYCKWDSILWDYGWKIR